MGYQASLDRSQSFVDVLFRVLFQKPQHNPNEVKVFKGLLIGLLGEHVQVRVHVTQETLCSEGSHSKAIKVSYLFIVVVSPYNIILGHFVINAIWAIISTDNLSLNTHYLMGESGSYDEINGQLKNIARIDWRHKWKSSPLWAPPP